MKFEKYLTEKVRNESTYKFEIPGYKKNPERKECSNCKYSYEPSLQYDFSPLVCVNKKNIEIVKPKWMQEIWVDRSGICPQHIK